MLHHATECIVAIYFIFYQVFILLRVSFICACTYEYICNVSSPATETESINNNNNCGTSFVLELVTDLTHCTRDVIITTVLKR